MSSGRVPDVAVENSARNAGGASANKAVLPRSSANEKESAAKKMKITFTTWSRVKKCFLYVRPRSFYVAVSWCMIVFFYSSWLHLHVLDFEHFSQRLQQDEVEQEAAPAGWPLTLLVSWLTALLVYHYCVTAYTHPGRTPDNETWQEGMVDTLECKGSTGEMRFCNRCDLFKPDRAHHCRICGSCVLRMDHHCPWIGNCVGYRNHAAFIRLLLLISATTGVMMVTTGRRLFLHEAALLEEAVLDAPDDHDPSGTTPPNISVVSASSGFRLGLLVVALVFQTGFSLVFFGFSAFQLWLASRGLTTIEYFDLGRKNPDRVLYDRGSRWGNLLAVFGGDQAKGEPNWHTERGTVWPEGKLQFPVATVGAVVKMEEQGVLGTGPGATPRSAAAGPGAGGKEGAGDTVDGDQVVPRSRSRGTALPAAAHSELESSAEPAEKESQVNQRRQAGKGLPLGGGPG